MEKLLYGEDAEDEDGDPKTVPALSWELMVVWEVEGRLPHDENGAVLLGVDFEAFLRRHGVVEPAELLFWEELVLAIANERAAYHSEQMKTAGDSDGK